MDQIGRCKGCDKPSRLDDGACNYCLNHPKRGRKWIETAIKCRTNPEFAIQVYYRIQTQRSTEAANIYAKMFGIPDRIVELINRPKIHLVR